MQRTCRNPWCKQPFEVTGEDLALLEELSPVIGGRKHALPSPTLCPDCREQRRLLYRNERKFYRRACDRTGKEVISIYSPDKPCTVYDQMVWWSDDWDQLATGRNFDFRRPFFTQFYELSLKAPRPCIMNMGSENSVYTHHSPYNKNCYMCISTGYCEDCIYLTNFSIHNKDCIDCLTIQKCELCSECVEARQCVSSTHLHECRTCTNCHFCFDCQGCSNCFGCWNLRHKQYCIANEQLTKEQYQNRLKDLLPATWEESEKREKEFRASVQEHAIHRNVVTEQCENITGDHISQCKDIRDSYYMFQSQECAYCYDCGDLKSSMDALEPYHGELQYETHACNLGYGLCSVSKSYECKNVHYSEYCFSCSDCFGCFGLRAKKHCIFNKQYTKEEYEGLVPQIIDHMRKTGEWGEFFPATSTVFGYNETAAQDYYLLAKEEALKRGWRWKHVEDDIPKVSRTIPASQLPAHIENVPDDILHWAITCEATSRPFKLVKPELELYRKMQLPVPHLHPDERHRRRMALRNPRHLWKRQCAKCRKEIQTTYGPDRPEKVSCEECYLKEVY
ncbi:MAG: hypothetical protein PHI23_02455 [Candidatus Peribacteraceae bacterium]|nr:hypothetical protein [Candidatus Peribacteraceae bacterium]